MESSDDDVWKRLLEKPRFELAAKGIFRLGRYIVQMFQVFGPPTRKARLPTVDRLTSGTGRRVVPVERSDRLPGRLRTGTSGPRYAVVRQCTSVKNSECQQGDLTFDLV